MSDRDYSVEVIEGFVESFDRIGRLIDEYEEGCGEPPTLELAYVVGRFDDVVRKLERARFAVRPIEPPPPDLGLEPMTVLRHMGGGPSDERTGS